MQLKIFFSHAWADSERATLKFLQSRLKERYDVWIDENPVPIGEAEQPGTLERIAHCEVYLIAWSKAAEASQAVQAELRTAFELSKRMIVCVIDGHSTVGSPYIRDLKYVSFAEDSLTDEAEWMHLSNLLLSYEADLRSAGIPIREELVSYETVGAELEDLIVRYRAKMAGNATNIFVQSELDEFVKLFGADEDQKMRLFAEAAQAITEHYPLGKNDKRRQLLLLQAVLDIDPEQTEPELQELRSFLEQQRTLDLVDEPETRPVGAASVTPAGATDTSRVEQAFRQLADRKLVAVQSSSSGSGDSYSSSSDVVQLQLFADATCRFRLVRSNYANHFGMVQDEQEAEGTWQLLQDKGRLFAHFTWKNNSPEKLELSFAGTNEVLLNNVRYGIFDLNYEV